MPGTIPVGGAAGAGTADCSIGTARPANAARIADSVPAPIIALRRKLRRPEVAGTGAPLADVPHVVAAAGETLVVEGCSMSFVYSVPRPRLRVRAQFALRTLGA